MSAPLVVSAILRLGTVLGAGTGTSRAVLQKLHTGQMPPAGRPWPEPTATGAVMTALESALDAEAAEHPQPGRVRVHRLNRAESRSVSSPPGAV